MLILQKDNFQTISQKEKIQDQAGDTQFCMSLFKTGLGFASSLDGPRGQGTNRLPKLKAVYKRENKGLWPVDILRRPKDTWVDILTCKMF